VAATKTGNAGRSRPISRGRHRARRLAWTNPKYRVRVDDQDTETHPL